MTTFCYSREDLNGPKKTVVELIDIVSKNPETNILEELGDLHPIFNLFVRNSRRISENPIFTKSDFEAIREQIKELYDKAHNELISVSELEALHSFMHSTEQRRVMPTNTGPARTGI